MRALRIERQPYRITDPAGVSPSPSTANIPAGVSTACAKEVHAALMSAQAFADGDVISTDAVVAC